MTLGAEPIRAVLFDYGHTLVDFSVPEDALHEVYAVIRERLQREANATLPRAEELVELVAGRVTHAVERSYRDDRLVELDIVELFQEALAELGFTFSEETVRWVAEAEHQALSTHLRCSDETVATLRAIHEGGVKIGLVSNAHLLPHMMRRDWDELGFGRFIQDSVISCEVGVRKPHPDIFLAALNKLRISAAETVFVGDRALDDVQGAHAVGMRAILTTEFRASHGRVQSQAEIDAYESGEPELVVDRLPEIIPFVLPG